MYRKTTILFCLLLIGSFWFISPVSADELARIKKEGEMKIAMSGAYPPFNFINEQNEVVGFDAAIGKEIAKRLGVKPVIVTTAWDGILAGLLAKKYDTICGSMTITAKRQKAVDFVGPYYRSGRGIFIRQNADHSSLTDLKGEYVGVTLGETHEKWARTQKGWKIKTYKGLPELLLELENGRIEAIVIDAIPGLLAIKKTKKPIKKMDLTSIDGGDVNIGIAIRKKNPQLKAAMQGALDDMMADGTYAAISQKWIGSDIR